MKRRMAPATTLATMAILVLCLGRTASADQCSGALPLRTATGCGALITVTAVDSEAGNATAFTVTSLGNGNPYDGLEDTLIGIQNNSGGTLRSITLSSPSSQIFRFDGDGPCTINTLLLPCSSDPIDYEGPHNTFIAISEDKRTGTVNFVTDENGGISPGGSTWFALEGTPLSLTTISQTFILQPGVTVSVTVGNNLYKFKPLDNLGGESLTITPVPILESVFEGGDPPETCVPVKDFTEAAGAHTCLEFQHDCSQGTAHSNDCATFHYQVKWIYDLPSDLLAIGGPDWGIKHGVDCPVFAGGFDESIFAFYSVHKIDPTHGGGSTGPSCNAPEWDRSAPVITTAAGFVGFEPPVSDTELNPIKAGRTLPLKWLQLDRFGTPVTNLTLCTNPTGLGCNPPWVRIQSTPIVCPGSRAPVTGGLTTLTGTFDNQGKGRYHFNWNTAPGSMGCVAVVLTFDTGVVASPANFIFK